MDVTFLSLIDLVRNICLAVFAVSIWYIKREEKRARILFNLSLDAENRSSLNLIEMIIELRDEDGLTEAFGKQIKTKDLVRLTHKMYKLRELDHVRNLSVMGFVVFIIIEIAMFGFYLLASFLN